VGRAAGHVSPPHQRGGAVFVSLAEYGRPKAQARQRFTMRGAETARRFLERNAMF
jgi:hypothetical protein